MGKRVLLATGDLLFRSKLSAVVTAAGGEVSRDAARCDLAVLELAEPGATEKIGELVGRGIPVLAYGAHVRPELLRSARDAGALAVPNSQVEARLRDLLKQYGRSMPRPRRPVGFGGQTTASILPLMTHSTT